MACIAVLVLLAAIYNWPKKPIDQYIMIRKIKIADSMIHQDIILHQIFMGT